MKKRKKNITVPIIALFIVILASLFVFTDFGNVFLNIGKTKGILIDKETGKSSAYSLEILQLENLEKQAVKNWVERNITSEKSYGSQVYYTLYNNAGKDMDMYLFMPEAKEIIGNIIRSNVKVAESGTSLMIYIDTAEKIIYNKEAVDLILHIYANENSKQANAKTERLIINGKTYSDAGSTFMVLD